MSRTHEFVASLFGDAIGSGREFVLFSEKRSTWVAKGIDEAVAAALKMDESADTYFHLALHDRAVALSEAARRALKAGKPVPKLSSTRGCTQSARVVGSVWADIDIAAPGHQKKNLPPSMDAIEDALRRMPLPPSWVLWTGGGAHVHWRLREPYEMETEDERGSFGGIVRGWQQLLRDTMGASLDSTHDLARVLRLPHLRSHKRGCMVEIVDSHPERAYNPSDFETFAMESRAEKIVDAGSFTLRETAVPPRDKMRVMLDNDAKFTATWTRRRRDLPSQSEYDLSLASFAVRAGWNDQEVVDLLIAHRNMHAQDLKMRADYYALTLSRARTESAAQKAVANLEASMSGHVAPAAAPVAAASATKLPDHDDADGASVGSPTAAVPPQNPPAPVTSSRADLLAGISQVVGARVQRVLKHLGDPPSYSIVLEGKTYTLGSVDALLNPNSFRSTIAAACGHVMRPMKLAAWHPVAQALLRSVEDIDLGPDSEPTELVKDWLRGFLAAHPVETRESEFDRAVTARSPLEREGEVVIFLEPLLRWIELRGVATRAQLTRQWAAKQLRALGARPLVLGYERDHGEGERTGQIRTTAYGWALPPHLVPTRAKMGRRPARAQDGSGEGRAA